jgi:hypothetical protein
LILETLSISDFDYIIDIRPYGSDVIMKLRARAVVNNIVADRTGKGEAPQERRPAMREVS